MESKDRGRAAALPFLVILCGWGRVLLPYKGRCVALCGVLGLFVEIYSPVDLESVRGAKTRFQEVASSAAVITGTRFPTC